MDMLGMKEGNKDYDSVSTYSTEMAKEVKELCCLEISPQCKRKFAGIIDKYKLDIIKHYDPKGYTLSRVKVQEALYCVKEGNFYRTVSTNSQNEAYHCCDGLKPVKPVGDPDDSMKMRYCVPDSCIEEGKTISKTSSQKCCPKLGSYQGKCIPEASIPATPKCNAKMNMSNNGDFSITSKDYPNEHNEVSGNDDDGYIALMLMNTKIKAGTKNPQDQYTITNTDRELIKNSFLRAKNYWRTEFGLKGIKDEDNFMTVASSLKSEDIQNHKRKELVTDGDWSEEELKEWSDERVEEAASYYRNLFILENFLTPNKVNSAIAGDISRVLGNRFGKHGYSFSPNNKDQSLCGEPVARCCSFERENVLSQSLCSQVEVPEDKKDTISKNLVCNVELLNSKNGGGSSSAKDSKTIGK